jgi:hypothetical protein
MSRQNEQERTLINAFGDDDKLMGQIAQQLLSGIPT